MNDKRLFRLAHPEARRRAMSCVADAPEGYVETKRAHDPRDFAPPTREVFDAIERDRAGHEHGMAYKTLKLPADKAAWAWAEFKVVPA